MLNNILAECARANIPRYQLANILGVDRKTLMKWINSEKVPATKLICIAQYFDVSTDYLTGRTDIRK